MGIRKGGRARIEVEGKVEKEEVRWREGRRRKGEDQLDYIDYSSVRTSLTVVPLLGYSP